MDRVEELKEDKKLRDKISKNNKEKAKNYYIENILNEYKKIYKLK
jgi:glycosyltransferase involved in cell wall biosynthesis